MHPETAGRHRSPVGAAGAAAVVVMAVVGGGSGCLSQYRFRMVGGAMVTALDECVVLLSRFFLMTRSLCVRSSGDGSMCANTVRFHFLNLLLL